ncbi:hypothetical protein H4219_002185 [Mycoemilia scoparia]|uniref:Uncharacterized protein n=1 Tax=Mycoemilia scoparia TaxID=417184 RepID=A0A9W8DPG3_9FUNG|nr:hypothetical protein H4219_002185 [Mycoemilia scoparia]
MKLTIGRNSRDFEGAYTRQRNQQARQGQKIYEDQEYKETFWGESYHGINVDSTIQFNPNDILKPDSPAAKILSTDTLAVTRQVEFLNIFMATF